MTKEQYQNSYDIVSAVYRPMKMEQLGDYYFFKLYKQMFEDYQKGVLAPRHFSAIRNNENIKSKLREIEQLFSKDEGDDDGIDIVLEIE